MPIDQAQRPQFYEGQYLGAEDLLATVEYSSLLEQRHSLGAHTWGIAIGLTLVETPTPDGSGAVTISISPGYAWDGFGRTIVVLAPYQVPADLFKNLVYDPAQDANTLPGRSIPIWMQYREVPTQPPANGFANCGNGNENSRIQETYQVVAGARGLSDQRDPITIGTWVGDAANALTQFDPNAKTLPDASVPHQDFPEQGDTAVWLVPLGCVQWLPNQNPGQAGSFVSTSIQSSDSQPLKDAKTAFAQASNALRQYLGVVANAVQAPNGLIRLKDRAKTPSSVNSQDLVWVEGSLRTEGDINLLGAKIDFKDNSSVDSNFQIQRAANANGGQELELVIGNQNAGANDLGIGPLNAAGNFAPAVVVLDNGNMGVATTTPTHKLHVNDNSGIRQNRLYVSGGDAWSSFSYNAYRNSANSGWAFPDPTHSALAIEMDDAGGSPSFQFWSTTLTATQTWSNVPLLAIDGNTGHVTINSRGNQGQLNLFPADADISYDGGMDKLFWIKAENNADTCIFGGNVAIGTSIRPTALLDINNTTKLGGDGSIVTPQWNVYRVIQQQPGPLPIIMPFNSGGGRLVIFASGSGYSGPGDETIGMQISIDGFARGNAQVFTNEAGSHKAFNAVALVVTGIAGGAHTVTLSALGPTQIDPLRDFFDVTILELPF